MVNIFKKIKTKFLKDVVSESSKNLLEFSILTNLNLNIDIINIDLSFLSNIDKKYIEFLKKKIEILSFNNYINHMTNDVRLKFIEKFKKLINSVHLLYIFSIKVLLNYNSIPNNVRISRAPPLPNI